MGGGGPIGRIMAAFTSFGTSELAQEKPFQNIGKDEPIGSASGSFIRFLPGGANIAGVMDAGTDSMTPEPPQPTTLPVLGADPVDEKAKAVKRSQEQAMEAERLRGGRGRASTMVTSPDDQGAPVRLKRFLGGY